MTDTSAAAERADAHVQTILKAIVVGARVPDAKSVPGGEGIGAMFGVSGALEPPYDPEALCLLFEHSNSLRQNVDAYATNIDGFGHRLDPAIDFDADDADRRVGECIYLERLAARDDAAIGVSDAVEPTPDEIKSRRLELVQLARAERARVTSFFEACSFEHSFVELRRRTRQDLEVTGNAYWEVLRNARGEVARLVYVPAYTMRLLPLDPKPVEVEETVRISPVTVERVATRQRMRRFLQIQYAQRTYFKAFGDTRVVSRTSGQEFASIDDLRAVRSDDGVATEILHFAIPSPRSPYGIPRWIGALLAVLGSRQMEEVNFSYFSNKSVPPLALLVSGGKLSEASIPRIERFIEENIKGKDNFHKILILEAEGGASPAVNDATRARIELRPLTEAQQHDALFAKYDEANIDKVGGAFRLPRLLRGDSREFNRSVADAQLRFAEDQVFQPERDEFDFVINRKLLADMGIRFWRFRSQTPVTRDPERMTDMVEKLVRVGVLTPEEGRVLASDIFNREFAKLGAAWTKMPITLTLAGIQSSSGTEEAARPPTETLVDQAKRLLVLREELAAEEQRVASRRMAMARDALAKPDGDRVVVPAHEWRSWFEETSDGR
ncbi:MAG: phage portal protein [Polyangiales bacterium]